jgi:hypothetical protein
LTVACNSGSKYEAIITIASNQEFLNASVFFDGRKVGDLQFNVLHGSSLEHLLQKNHGTTQMDNMVALNIEIPHELASSDHEIRVEKKGYKTVIKQIHFPTSSHNMFVFVEPQIDSMTKE